VSFTSYERKELFFGGVQVVANENSREVPVVVWDEGDGGGGVSKGPWSFPEW